MIYKQVDKNITYTYDSRYTADCIPGIDLSERNVNKLCVKTIAKSRNTRARFENLESAAKLHCILSIQVHVNIVFEFATYVWIHVSVPGFCVPQCSSQHIEVKRPVDGTQGMAQLSDP